jgi:hypothetical protein
MQSFFNPNQQYAFIDEEIERQRKWKLQSSQQIIEHQLKDSNDSSRTREINRRWKAIYRASKVFFFFCLTVSVFFLEI